MRPSHRLTTHDHEWLLSRIAAEGIEGSSSLCLLFHLIAERMSVSDLAHLPLALSCVQVKLEHTLKGKELYCDMS